MVQTLLVFQSIISSFRGIFYGFSFAVFEEKIFYNFFKKLYDKCLKDDYPDEEEEENNKIIRNTNNVSTSSDIDENKKKLETGDEKEKVDNETDSKDDNESNKVDSVEMDNSDYHYSENN